MEFSSQCTMTGVPKAVVGAILSVLLIGKNSYYFCYYNYYCYYYYLLLLLFDLKIFILQSCFWYYYYYYNISYRSIPSWFHNRKHHRPCSQVAGPGSDRNQGNQPVWWRSGKYASQGQSGWGWVRRWKQGQLEWGSIYLLWAVRKGFMGGGWWMEG